VPPASKHWGKATLKKGPVAVGEVLEGCRSLLAEAPSSVLRIAGIEPGAALMMSFRW